MNSYISPILIPIAAMTIPVVAIVVGAVSQLHSRSLKAAERMAMIARGIPLAEIDAYTRSTEDAVDRGPRDPHRSLTNARRSALVLLAVGAGLIVFGYMMEVILRERDVLVIAAAGVIPFAIGIGFLIDYILQKREMARFGLEIGADKR